LSILFKQILLVLTEFINGIKIRLMDVKLEVGLYNIIMCKAIHHRPTKTCRIYAYKRDKPRQTTTTTTGWAA